MVKDDLGQEILEEAEYLRDIVSRCEVFSEEYYKLSLVASMVESIGLEVVKGDKKRVM